MQNRRRSYWQSFVYLCAHKYYHTIVVTSTSYIFIPPLKSSLPLPVGPNTCFISSRAYKILYKNIICTYTNTYRFSKYSSGSGVLLSNKAPSEYMWSPGSIPSTTKTKPNKKPKTKEHCLLNKNELWLFILIFLTQYLMKISPRKL